MPSFRAVFATQRRPGGRRRALFAGDSHDLKPLAAHSLLEIDQVRDRPEAGRTPGPPEIEQDEVGVDVLKMNRPALEVGQAKILDPAVFCVKPAEDERLFGRGLRGRGQRLAGGSSPGSLFGRRLGMRGGEIAPAHSRRGRSGWCWYWYWCWR